MRGHRRIWIALALLVLASLACGTAAEPKEFVSEAGGFSINFPGDPKEETQSVPTAVGDISLTLYTVSNSDSAYVAGYADYPPDLVAASDAQSLLDGGRDGALNNIDGVLLSESDISVDGYPGRRLEVESGDGKNLLYAHFFMVEARLYQVMVVTTPDGLSEDEVNTFLNSFKLTD